MAKGGGNGGSDNDKYNGDGDSDSDGDGDGVLLPCTITTEISVLFCGSGGDSGGEVRMEGRIFTKPSCWWR